MLAAMPNHFAVTLKYPTGPIGMGKIQRDLNALRARLDRKYLGRNYTVSPHRASYWAVAEMLDVAPHVHTAWHFSNHGHANAMARLLDTGVWEAIFAPGGGSHDLQIIAADGYVGGNGWAGYATKSLKTLDHLIISDNAEIAPADRGEIHSND